MSSLQHFDLGTRRDLSVLGVSLCLFIACGSNQSTGDGEATATGSQTSVTGGQTTVGSETVTATNATGTTGTGMASASDISSTASQSSSVGGASSSDTVSSSSSGGAGSETASSGGGGQGGGAFTLSSPAFEGVPECSATNPSVCDVVPEEHVSYMESPNNSPELAWTGAPLGTQSFVVALADLTYAQPMWAIWNIPGDLSGLPANIEKDTATPATPAGAQQSNATFAEGDGYFGPQSPCNVYQFVVYALSTPTFAPSDPQYVAVALGELEALGDVILGSASLRARANFGMMCE